MRTPHLRKDIEAIENVQRRATRMIPGMQGLTYPERLTKLKIPTLAYRRLRGEMIELYKMTSGYYDIDTLDQRLTPSQARDTRGHSKKLLTRGARIDCRKHSFFNRAIEPWNSLSEDIVSSTSIIQFESRLDRYWKDHPLKLDHLSRERSHRPTTHARI